MLGTKHFGHWLCDDALTYLLANSYGTPVCYSQSYASNHKPIYAKYFDQDWSPIDRSVIEHLIVFQDYGQTSLKKKRQLELRSKVEMLYPHARAGAVHLFEEKRYWRASNRTE